MTFDLWVTFDLNHDLDLMRLKLSHNYDTYRSKASKCDKNQEEDKSEINSAWPLRMSWYVRICISEVDPLLGWIHPCGPYCLPAARVQGRQSSTLLSPHHLPNILSHQTMSSYFDQCFRDKIKVFSTDDQEEKRKSR